jgi:hypothetical protein
MFSNPFKLKISDENAERIEYEQKYINDIPVARIINRRLNESYSTLPLEFLYNTLTGLPEVFRMKEMNTADTISSIKRYLRRPNIERVIFAAKSDALNDFVLVTVVEMSDITIVIDNSSNNLARTPRISEIAELFQEWNRNKTRLESKTVYIANPIEDTQSKAPEVALREIYKYKAIPFSLENFLKVLSSCPELIDTKQFGSEISKS